MPLVLMTATWLELNGKRRTQWWMRHESSGDEGLRAVMNAMNRNDECVCRWKRLFHSREYHIMTVGNAPCLDDECLVANSLCPAHSENLLRPPCFCPHDGCPPCAISSEPSPCASNTPHGRHSHRACSGQQLRHVQIASFGTPPLPPPRPLAVTRCSVTRCSSAARAITTGRSPARSGRGHATRPARDRGTARASCPRCAPAQSRTASP